MHVCVCVYVRTDATFPARDKWGDHCRNILCAEISGSWNKITDCALSPVVRAAKITGCSLDSRPRVFLVGIYIVGCLTLLKNADHAQKGDKFSFLER